MDHPARRPGAVDGGLQQRGEERGDALGGREREQGDPAPRHEQYEAHGHERKGPPETAPEVVAEQRELLPCGRLQVLHRLGPRPVDRERRGGHEERHQPDAGKESGSDPDCPPGRGEEVPGYKKYASLSQNHSFAQATTPPGGLPTRERAMSGSKSRLSKRFTAAALRAIIATS